MEAEFMNRELKLCNLSGEKLDSNIQELIDNFKKALNYRIVEPFTETWYNHLDQEVLKIDHRNNRVLITTSHIRLPIGFNSELYKILIEYVLEIDLSYKDLSFIFMVGVDVDIDFHKFDV